MVELGNVLNRACSLFFFFFFLVLTGTKTFPWISWGPTVTKPVMTVFLPLPDILQGNFKPDYYLKHIQKDLRLAISMGDMANHPTPMAAAANEVQLCFSVSCSCCLSSNMWASGQQKRFVQPLSSRCFLFCRFISGPRHWTSRTMTFQQFTEPTFTRARRGPACGPHSLRSLLFSLCH